MRQIFQERSASGLELSNPNPNPNPVPNPDPHPHPNPNPNQVVAECSAQADARHEGSFNTDAAEAVLLGFFSVLELGWVHRSPSVRRYQNGDIVVPKKPPAAPKKRF